MNIFFIALTGGPLAGKDAVQEKIQPLLIPHNINTVLVSETATEMILEGLLQSLDPLEFQRQLLKRQIQKEIQAENDARRLNHPDPTIILCNRGIADNAAYMRREEYHTLLSEQELTEQIVFDGYDLVLHLESLAVHDQAKYLELCTRNPARKETPEQAIEKDRLTLAAWKGHSRHRVIGNDGGMELKISTVVEEILTLVNES